MILIQGEGVSKGIASGSICFFQRSDITILDVPATNIENEKVRIAQARKKSIVQLTNLAEKARREAGDESAMLFETHAMLVEDADYVECILTALEKQGCTAERAVEMAGEQFSTMLAIIDDAYMQARSADITDVTRRILNNLMGIVEAGIPFESPVILAADDLTPSETLHLDKNKILGIITQGGSGNSHTA